MNWQKMNSPGDRPTTPESMKVFLVECDRRFQDINFDDLEKWPIKLKFNATAHLPRWHNPDCGYAMDPRLPNSEFRAFCQIFVVEKRLLEDRDMAAIFAKHVELLPAKIDGEECFLVNVMTLFRNALVLEKTEWRIAPGPTSTGVIRRACFRASEIGGGALFKVPQNAWRSAYCVSDDSLEHDFYRTYHDRGYRGLVFTEQMLIP